MNIIIVSAYFKIPSKFTHDTYLPFLLRFFRSVPKHIPLLFFTSTDVVEELKTHIALQDNMKFIIIDDIYSTWIAFRKFGLALWQNHALLDQEKHSPELAAVWYEKTHFILRAASMAPEDDKNVFVWCDAGCVRNDESEHCLTEFGSRFVMREGDHTLHLQCVDDIEKKDFYSHLDKCVAAAIMFGSKKAWTNHQMVYDDMLLTYNKNNYCISKDQHILLSCAHVFPEWYTLHKLPDKLSVDPWFFFLEFF